MEKNQTFNTNLKSGLASDRFSVRARRDGLSSNDNLPPRQTSFSPESLPASDPKLIIQMLDKIIGLSIAALFFGVPLFFTGLALQGITFEKQLYFYFWILLGLVSWSAKGVITGEMNIRRTPLDFPILGFWLAYVAATVFSVDRWHSFWGAFGDPSRGLMSITALVIAYYLILSNFNEKRLKLILTGVVSSGTITLIWTLLAILGIQFLPQSVAQFAPISLVGSISGLGIFFSALLPILLVSTLKVAENESLSIKKRKVVLGVLLFVMALDLFLMLAIYNFVPWLGLFVGVALFLVFVLSKVVRPKINWVWLPMVIFILVMAIKMIGELPIAKVSLPIEVSPAYQSSWDIAKSSIKNKFIVGSGPATYGYDFSLYRPQDFNLNNFYNLRFFQGTGVVLESLPTIGIIGSVLLVVFLLSFVSIEFYLLYREKEKNKLYSLGIFAAALIILVDVVSTRTEGSILLIGALIGILSLAQVLRESEVHENYLNLSLKASPKFALALAFVFMVVSASVAFLFVFLGKIYAADIYAGKADRQIALNQEKAIMDMGKSINLYDKEGKYYTQLGQYYMILANTEALKPEQERDIQKIQQLLNYSIAATRQGADLGKNDVNTVETLAQIYENAGLYVADSLSLAQETYQRGLELEPNNPNFYLKLGQIKISMAGTKKDEAEKKQQVLGAADSFKESVNKKVNFAPGYYQLALVNDALKETDQAIENATKAVQINPQNNEYLLSLARLYQSRGKDEDMKTAEQIYKIIVARNDNDVNGHFYLGLLYEKMKNKTEAKNELKKVISLLPEDSSDAKKQLEKMISNIDAGIENTPQSLGLAKDDNQTSKGDSSDNSAGNGETPAPSNTEENPAAGE